MSTMTQLEIADAAPAGVEGVQQPRRREYQNDVEKYLTKVWGDVLEISPDIIGSRENFFDLGGQALHAAVVITKVNKSLNLTLPLTTLFNFPTIETMARSILNITA